MPTTPATRRLQAGDVCTKIRLGCAGRLAVEHRVLVCDRCGQAHGPAPLELDHREPFPAGITYCPTCGARLLLNNEVTGETYCPNGAAEPGA